MGELRVANARTVSCSEFTGGIEVQEVHYLYVYRGHWNIKGNKSTTTLGTLESVNDHKSLLYKAVDKRGSSLFKMYMTKGEKVR